MLPVGFDQGGVPVWWQASARWCTAGIGRGFTWLDCHDGAGLEEVAHLWLELWQDPLWRQVLPRAVIYYLEANRQGRDAPSFLEVKWLRNQVVHPGLRDGLFGPKQEVVLAGWTLACWYVELLLLRRLGYTGRISNRLTVDHWVGQTVPVPWANG